MLRCRLPARFKTASFVVTSTAAEWGAESNHFDSIVALDTQTGAVKWATRALPYDTWNVNCIDIPGFPVAGVCPDPAGVSDGTLTAYGLP